MSANAVSSNGSLRFCIVSTFYPPCNFGGDGIYAYRLANGLARRGHQVTVIHSPSAYEMLAGRKPTADYDDHPNVHVEPLRTPLGKWGLLAVQQTGRPCFQGPALRRMLSDRDYDVIHYNNVSLLGGPHAFRMGQGLKLCSLIEHWLVCPMHVLWRMNREVCTRPTCIRCQLHGRRPPQLWRHTGLMRRATRHIDAFIGPSLFTMNMHRERGLRGAMIQLPLFHPEPGEPPAGASRTGMVSDATRRDFAPADPGLGSSRGADTPASRTGARGSQERRDMAGDSPSGSTRPYFLFVGRLEEIKGAQTLVPLFRKLAEVDLILVGDGTYAGELKRQAVGADNIRFLGRKGGVDLHRLYGGAIATLVPSLCYETFGIVVAESFCARTPVIVYAQSSLDEIVRTCGGGIAYRTADELERAVRTLRENKALRDRLAAEGRTAYEGEFAEEPFLIHYLAVVGDLLERKRTGKPIVEGTAETAGSIAGRVVMA